MKTYMMVVMLLSPMLLSITAAWGQTTAPTMTRAGAGATRPSGPVGVTLPDENGIPRLYPTNPVTIITAKAGILNLCAQDIPRYTQTGPFPTTRPGTRAGVIPPVPHNSKLPTIWTIGDSTVRTGSTGTGDGMVGQWGWGAPLVGYFDPTKVNVVNRAVGGTTSGSFYLAMWKAMVDLIKPGDVVIMQFGTNSGGVESPGIGDASTTRPGRNGQGTITARSYGWYIRQIITEARAKGATPVVCSLIPRNARGADGKIRRSTTTQAGWARQTAAQENTGFIDLNELVARKYDAMDKSQVDAMYAGTPHTSWTGAVMNAETVISGLKALHPDPVAQYYVPQVSEIAPATEINYDTPTTEPAK
jgi:rhamnogalacturonan acetylesterase